MSKFLPSLGGLFGGPETLDADQPPEAVAVDEDLAAAFSDPDLDRPAYRIRPYTDHDGIEAGIGFLNATRSMSRALEDDEAHAFELRYDDGLLDFQLIPGSAAVAPGVERQLRTKYPNAEVEPTTGTVFPVKPGEYAAGVTLSLKKYTLNPIKHIDLADFEADDPFSSITSEMTAPTPGQENVRALAQVMFRPAPEDWTEGVNGGPSVNEVAHDLREPSHETNWRVFSRETIEVDPSPAEKKAAKIIQGQRNAQAWWVIVRVVGVAADEETARDRAHHTAGLFHDYYQGATGQTFVRQPLAGDDHAPTTARALAQVARREWTDAQICKSQSELGGLVRLPTEEVSNAPVDWAMTKAGRPVPPRTPRFDYSQTDVDAADPLADRMEALLGDQDPGDPYWFGTGSREGTEAGVYADVLDTHAFVPGQTGVGKTTQLKSLFWQVANRGHGSLFYDPKGMDAEEVVSLVPEDREEDLVFVELGGDRDQQVGFNFLEVPGTADPGSAAYTDALESMADDLESILPLGGNAEGDWGVRMSRITRNLTRGLAKLAERLERDVTLADIHAIASSAAGREMYASRLSQEDIDWVVDYAETHFSELSEQDIEPFAGRVAQFVENDSVRDIVTITDGLSIDDVVEDGKIVVVQDKSSSDTVGKMVATALIRRLWVAVREQTHDDDRPDPGQFVAFLDEFDDIATVNSDIAQILSEARSFGLSIVAACQDLSAQLDGEVLDAIEGQTATKATYRASRDEDARLFAGHHDRDVDRDDLMNISKYHLMLRTTDHEDALTHSFKVAAFPPVDEVLDVGRDPDEVEALKEASIDRYGVRRKSSEEVREQSMFMSGDGADESDAEAGEAEQARVAKAVYDEALREGASAGAQSTPADGDATAGWIRADACRERVDRYLEREVAHTSQMWGLLDQIPEDHIEREERDGAVYLRTTDRGARHIFETGSGAGAGGGKHRLLLRDVYAPLTRAGLEVALPEQTGSDDVDGVGRLREVLDVDELSELSLREVADRREQFEADHPVLAALTDGADVTLEAESSTGTTKPAQTCLNLTKAHATGQKCLFLCRPEAAPTVWRTLTDPPYVSEAAPRTFYNAGKLAVGGQRPVRPGDARRTVWYEDPGTEEIVLSDSMDRDLARFDSPDDVFNDPAPYTFASDVDDPEGDDWVTVNRPFLPRREFNGDPPTRDDWEVVVVPTDADECLSVIREGKEVPLPSLAETSRDGQGPDSDSDVRARLSELEDLV